MHSEEKALSLSDISKATNFGEVKYCVSELICCDERTSIILWAAIEKGGDWFQIVGRADYSLSSPVLLPVTSQIPNVAVDPGCIQFLLLHLIVFDLFSGCNTRTILFWGLVWN